MTILSIPDYCTELNNDDTKLTISIVVCKYFMNYNTVLDAIRETCIT